MTTDGSGLAGDRGSADGGAAASLLEALPAAVFAVDPGGALTFWNPAAERLWGCRPSRGTIGLADGWSWPDGRSLAPGEGPLARALAGAGEGGPVELLWRRPDGGGTPCHVHAAALRGPDGTVIGALGLAVELAEESDGDVDRERLAAIVDSSNDAIVSKTLDGIVTTWNAGAERIFGYAADEMIGRPITTIIPEERQAEETRILARLRQGERIESFETVRLTKDGRPIDISLTVSPLRDRHGRVVGASKVARDVTERRRVEEMQRLLFDELNHRVKNSLATIQAIARQSLRRSSDPAAFVESFTGRVQALARAHDLLVEGEFRGAGIAGLVREQALFGPGDGRSQVAGPQVTLEPRAAVQLALVLHELATNARKHGALSVEDGRLAIRWQVVVNGGDDAGRRLVLTWEETGVAGTRALAAPGFGTTLINRSLEGAGGAARLTYGPDGLTCVLEVPLPDPGAALPRFGEVPAARPEPAWREAPAPASALAGRRVLVVEDEPLVALDVEGMLADAGSIVIGPATSVAQAMALLAEGTMDAALLDANLGGASVEAVADALAARGVPFAFATGYGREALPEEHRGAPLLAKPVAAADLLAVVAGLVAAGRG